MVGIYKYNCGLKIVAISKNEDTAIKALYNKFAPDYAKDLTPREWWENGKKYNCGAPRCYEIKEIEQW